MGGKRKKGGRVEAMWFKKVSIEWPYTRFKWGHEVGEQGINVVRTYFLSWSKKYAYRWDMMRERGGERRESKRTRKKETNTTPHSARQCGHNSEWEHFFCYGERIKWCYSEVGHITWAGLWGKLRSKMSSWCSKFVVCCSFFLFFFVMLCVLF